MTNPAYEATNSDVEKLIKYARINAECGEHASPEETLKLVAALQREVDIRAQNLSIKLHMAARISELEALTNTNGMMQLSNELAEMKRKCAELEARSITVKWPDYVDGRTLGYGEVNHMIDLCVDAVELACHASGIRIKSED